MAIALFDNRTWVPATVCGIVGKPNFQLEVLVEGLADMGELSLHESDPRYFRHFVCLGLWERRPLLRDKRTGECMLSQFAVEETAQRTLKSMSKWSRSDGKSVYSNN